MKYWEQLKDPRWQEKRLGILDRAKFRCESCDEKPEGESLEIHHKYYEKGLMAWDYPDCSLACLCAFCHQEAARSERSFLRTVEPRDYFNLIYFAEALHRTYEAGLGIKTATDCLNEFLSKKEVV